MKRQPSPFGRLVQMLLNSEVLVHCPPTDSFMKFNHQNPQPPKGDHLIKIALCHQTGYVSLSSKNVLERHLELSESFPEGTFLKKQINKQNPHKKNKDNFSR